MDAAIEAVRPGARTDEVAAVWPAATDFGIEDEMAAFGLQFGHGLGLGLHERPVISRLNSMREPIELQVGMVFALETYCPADDGFSAARIEEEIVVTEDGPRVLTPLPGPGPGRRQPVLVPPPAAHESSRLSSRSSSRPMRCTTSAGASPRSRSSIRRRRCASSTSCTVRW